MKWIFLFAIQLVFFFAPGQCRIKSDVQQNGLVFKYTEKELLYVTRSYTLFSAAFHDGQKYYLKVVISPMKSKKVKKDQFTLELKNGKKFDLDFYDSFEVKKDSAFDVLFRIKDDVLAELSKSDVTAITINIDSGSKRYKLVNHHALIRKQLNCLVKEIADKE